MNNNFMNHSKTFTVSLCAIAVLTLTVFVAGSAQAAPPYSVSYHGTPVTTAVPGKAFNLKFQVKNTGDTVYSGVKVIFHIPEGLTYSSVSPANADIQDDTITWHNVPIAEGKTFNPSFTFTLDSGTPLKTKKSIWVEVTGEDMEANSKNFSVTAVKAVKTATTTLTSADISSLFQTVYGRTATASELKYWLGRRADKPGRTALQGAMGYHKHLNIQH